MEQSAASAADANVNSIASETSATEAIGENTSEVFCLPVEGMPESLDKDKSLNDHSCPCSLEPPPGLEFEPQSQLQSRTPLPPGLVMPSELPEGILTPPPGLEMPFPLGTQRFEDMSIDAGMPMHVPVADYTDEKPPRMGSKAHSDENDSDRETCAGSDVSSSEASQSDSTPSSCGSSLQTLLPEPGYVLRTAMQAQLTPLGARLLPPTFADTGCGTGVKSNQRSRCGRKNHEAAMETQGSLYPKVDLPFLSVGEVAAAWHSWHVRNACMPQMTVAQF